MWVSPYLSLFLPLSTLSSVGVGLGKPAAAPVPTQRERQVSLVFQKYTQLAHRCPRTPILGIRAVCSLPDRDCRAFSNWCLCAHWSKPPTLAVLDPLFPPHRDPKCTSAGITSGSAPVTRWSYLTAGQSVKPTGAGRLCDKLLPSLALHSLCCSRIYLRCH